MEKLGIISKEAKGFRVVFEREFPYPIETVWRAITDPEELKFWFTDISLELKAGSLITFQFRDKEQTKSFGQVVSIEAPSRFVWTWEGELAEWELTALEEGHTRLVFSYSGIASDMPVSVAAGFHDLLDLLGRRLGGSTDTEAFGAEQDASSVHPAAIHYAAHVYDDYPQAVRNEPVVMEKKLDFAIEKVWLAITDPERMRKWYFAMDDFKPVAGFRFRFPGQGSRGESYMHLCTVTEVVPGRKLQYSWTYDGFPGYSLVTFLLTPLEDGGTHIRLTHHGLETFPKDLPDFARSSFTAGWKEIIGNMLPGYLQEG